MSGILFPPVVVILVDVDVVVELLEPLELDELEEPDEFVELEESVVLEDVVVVILCFSSFVRGNSKSIVMNRLFSGGIVAARTEDLQYVFLLLEACRLILLV